MRFDVLTLFPEMFSGYVGQSLLKRAVKAGIVDVRMHNIRDWATGKQRQVDDRPFGGGPGMVLRPEPVVACVEAVQADGAAPGHLVLLSPQGRPLEVWPAPRLQPRQLKRAATPSWRGASQTKRGRRPPWR